MFHVTSLLCDNDVFWNCQSRLCKFHCWCLLFLFLCLPWVLAKMWETTCRLGPLRSLTSERLTDSSQVSAEATHTVLRETTRSSWSIRVLLTRYAVLRHPVGTKYGLDWSPFYVMQEQISFSGYTDNVHCLLFLHARPGPGRKMVRWFRLCLTPPTLYKK